MSRVLVRVLVMVVVVASAAGGAWWFLLRPAPSDEVADDGHVEISEEEHGEVLPLEAVSINLSDGYLRVGLALQGAVDAKEAPEGSAALDAANEILAGRSKADLADPAVRDELRTALADRVSEIYEDEVVDVYFTEFVTQ